MQAASFREEEGRKTLVVDKMLNLSKLQTGKMFFSVTAGKNRITAARYKNCSCNIQVSIFCCPKLVFDSHPSLVSNLSSACHTRFG